MPVTTLLSPSEQDAFDLFLRMRNKAASTRIHQIIGSSSLALADAIETQLDPSNPEHAETLSFLAGQRQHEYLRVYHSGNIVDFVDGRVEAVATSLGIKVLK